MLVPGSESHVCLLGKTLKSQEPSFLLPPNGNMNVLSTLSELMRPSRYLILQVSTTLLSTSTEILNVINSVVD